MARVPRNTPMTSVVPMPAYCGYGTDLVTITRLDTGGNWIESKVIANALTIKNYPLKYFTAMQRITMDSLTQRGDTCFVAILWYGEFDQSFLFMPWYIFRRVRIWDTRTVVQFSVPYIGPASLDMRAFYWDEGKWDGARWRAEKFDAWVHKDNFRVYDSKYVPDVLNEPAFDEEDEDAPA